MQVPLQVTFENIEHSDAIESRIGEDWKKLEPFSDSITSARVVVGRPQHRHHKGDSISAYPSYSSRGSRYRSQPRSRRYGCPRRRTGAKTELEPVSAFAAIADKNERAIALFNEAGKVIQNPRCMNCHPAKVVEKLKQKGHEAIAAAPNTGVNTITGEGLADALAGAQVVVDVANSPSFEDQAAMDFFQTAGKNLTAAEVVAGIKHHVALSVVGTERLLDSGYFRAKLAQEKLIKNAPIPYTIVHATQFFEFLRGVAQFSTEGDTVRLPHSLFQPMAGRGCRDRCRRRGSRCTAKRYGRDRRTRFIPS